MSFGKLILDLVVELLSALREHGGDPEELRARVRQRLQTAIFDMDNLDAEQAKRWKDLHDAIDNPE